MIDRLPPIRGFLALNPQKAGGRSINTVPRVTRRPGEPWVTAGLVGAELLREQVRRRVMAAAQKSSRYPAVAHGSARNTHRPTIDNGLAPLTGPGTADDGLEPLATAREPLTTARNQ
ncbi:hypothetical protein Acsp01_48380 [Actinoplanes sp. NBRC 101535]|nr:hypothetical protein Acsp01_48380 [Actinoplanes sp. NBRC 101535]